MNQGQSIQQLQRRGQFRQPPTQREGLRIQRFGAARMSPVDYFVYRDVLEELTFAADYRGEPAYAALTGGFGVNGERGFVEVTGFENLIYPDDQDLVNTFLETLRRIDQLPQNEVIVGLFASAPGSKAHISDQAAHLHLSLFNIPFQPLLVVDAKHDAMAVYGRAPRRTFVDAPLFLVSPNPTPNPSPDPEDSAQIDSAEPDSP